ncbi:WcaF family extracellular polysaccharide biosynthesis acetyltransferase [Sphaerotilus sulfidivorans]|uniref:putative colanic acid biosynthesis acetyltransferase n=1 Tax=Sphaerotilus sp. FB-3 TaxID=2913396 RepID=UPI00283A90A0|nr:putative colanic acid biosynthesis acetyltransferase [Sphaerotilus sp. FB-3]
MLQDLSRFRIPAGFRGRPGWYVQLWWAVQSTLFRCSPQFAYSYRAALLRIFGAKVGKNVVIRPTATFTYPWKVEIGDYSWIGDNAVIYSLGEISIGAHSVISQRSYLCAGDHDYQKIDFPIRGQHIKIGDQCWLAADTFVAPGTTIGSRTVVGARSSVFSDLPADMVCLGSPCKPIKTRVGGEVLNPM